MNNEASITRFANTIYSRWIRWPNGPYWVCKRFVKFEFDFISNQIKSKAVMVILSYKYRNNLVPSAPLTYTLQSCVRPFSVSTGFSFASWPVTTVYSYTSVVSLISNLQNDLFNLKNIWLNFSNIVLPQHLLGLFISRTIFFSLLRGVKAMRRELEEVGWLIDIVSIWYRYCYGIKSVTREVKEEARDSWLVESHTRIPHASITWAILITSVHYVA